MPKLPYPKRPFKARGAYESPRNPSGRSVKRYVKLRLSPRRRFFGK